jgi:hypothetical protein
MNQPKCNRNICPFLCTTKISDNNSNYCCLGCKNVKECDLFCEKNIYSRFLIYKGSGGIGHNLNGLMTAINICEKQKRTLIIDMGMHKAFKIPFSKIFIIRNLTIPYLEPNDLDIKNILYKDKTLNDIFNNPIKFNKLNNKETYTIFDDLISDPQKNNDENIVILATYHKSKKTYDIQINNDIINMLNEEEIITEKYISVHFRNTDKKNDINKFILCIKKLIKETNINILYLASDYNEAYDIILDSIPTLKIIRKTIPPKNIRNLHYSSENKFQELYECIRDIYYICKSTYFIPSVNSSFSETIIDRIIKRKKNSFFFKDLVSDTQIVIP